MLIYLNSFIVPVLVYAIFNAIDWPLSIMLNLEHCLYWPANDIIGMFIVIARNIGKVQISMKRGKTSIFGFFYGKIVLSKQVNQSLLVVSNRLTI